ncbi:Phosphoribosylamine--glycine ligase [Desulfovibrio sp. X2]|uniref:phosphoribosylamine--glycine ligase n=1 Tax=Desulfovibrio sp. X2 TaxID=941449 RepID=UPI000358C425|nr:phosphoribosylamine--glycine ligase [Desulfovibrio sp. X2]EPR43700.1 Phosphoribosylamine--glycine ligase [Desulfovibrio sp. X2]
MNVLIVGSGGREHALAWKIAQSPLVEKIYTAPGNGGTALLGENVAIGDDDVKGLVSFAKKHDVGLVVAGPELPLTRGLANAMHDAKIPCFGPTEYCAQLEGSKSFAKQVMLETGVPTAHFAVFEDFAQAKDFIEETGAPLVIKADGLAAGKGVAVCQSVQEALFELEQSMVHKRFGTAGEKIVVEEMLGGEEVSFLAFCDGERIAAMPSSQDHKAVGEGDTGPNTGGMGAFSPAHILPEDAYQDMAELVLLPIVRHMKNKGHPFVGVLYAGLMVSSDGPKVLEYNVRFGDPECQPLLMRLDTDLVEIMLACCKGRLDQVDIRWKPQTALCVVMSAEGYPGGYAKGMRITGIDEAEADSACKVFVAGAQRDEDGWLVSTGGRVLGVTALGDDLTDARGRAYSAVGKISFAHSYCRRDIGEKGLKWESEGENK